MGFLGAGLVCGRELGGAELSMWAPLGPPGAKARHCSSAVQHFQPSGGSPSYTHLLFHLDYAPHHADFIHCLRVRRPLIALLPSLAVPGPSTHNLVHPVGEKNKLSKRLSRTAPPFQENPWLTADREDRPKFWWEEATSLSKGG